MEMGAESYENILKAWRNISLNSASEVDRAIKDFWAIFTYNSNKIENSNSEYIQTPLEIENQEHCYDFLREKIVTKEPITPALILEIHNILMNGCYDTARWEQGERPGQFKKHDYVTGDGVGLDPEEVEESINALCGEINAAPDDKALTVASYMHLKFESIHPFADGNGRVGRTLMNYYLMTHGYPPAVLYEEDKKTYYMALAVYDKAEDISGFEQFLKEQTIKTWSKNAKPIKTLSFFL